MRWANGRPPNAIIGTYVVRRLRLGPDRPLRGRNSGHIAASPVRTGVHPQRPGVALGHVGDHGAVDLRSGELVGNSGEELWRAAEDIEAEEGHIRGARVGLRRPSTASPPCATGSVRPSTSRCRPGRSTPLSHSAPCPCPSSGAGVGSSTGSEPRRTRCGSDSRFARPGTIRLSSFLECRLDTDRASPSFPKGIGEPAISSVEARWAPSIRTSGTRWPAEHRLRPRDLGILCRAEQREPEAVQPLRR
jgi:hypothetical protein